MSKNFESVAAFEGNENYEKLISRLAPIYEREGDLRSPFARDYTRILHSRAYSRLKHKTQVFYNVSNDHICTRMEHTAQVESAANTIAAALGLNCELTRAIAFGHDIGHAPFGHRGEKILDKIAKIYANSNFWHEQNGLKMADCIELLEDGEGNFCNLNLSYAVRDGIIGHCGEIDKNGLKARGELFELRKFASAGEYEPATYEGCAVKLSDKIAYIGRDIEDAAALGFLGDDELEELYKIAGGRVNTTVIMHELILDACENSTVEQGITLSKQGFERLNAIKRFNYEYIYNNSRLDDFCEFAELVINALFKRLYTLFFFRDMFAGRDVFARLRDYREIYPKLCGDFSLWLSKYCADSVLPEEYAHCAKRYKNARIYGELPSPEICAQAVIDFISGMTDCYALKLYDELITF